jgi:hypothetical protein
MFGESNLQTFRDGWRVLTTILRERLGGSVLTRPARPARAPSVSVGATAGLGVRPALRDGETRGSALGGDRPTGGEWAVQLLRSREEAAGRTAEELRHHAPLPYAETARARAFGLRAVEAGSDED